MNARAGGDERAKRARRLLRWYPKRWRVRYGDEFAELLMADFSERPHSWGRSGNVAWSGVVARLGAAGLTGPVTEPSEQMRESLVALGCALATFLVFATSMWSQLTIGWQWSRPDTLSTTVAMVVMSVAVLLLVPLALLAAVPIAWTLVRRCARRNLTGLAGPSLLFLAGGAVLVVGALHFGNGWPGTGGHPWHHQGLVPGGVAAFTWASTLWVSSYWAHPGALLSFPTIEVAWMAISPAAVACLVIGPAKSVRRLELSPAVLGYETWLGRVATVAMLGFVTGSCFWLVDGGPGPRNLFHAGVIDGVGLTVLAAALAVAHTATGRSRRARRTLLASTAD